MSAEDTLKQIADGRRASLAWEYLEEHYKEARHNVIENLKMQFRGAKSEKELLAGVATLTALDDFADVIKRKITHGHAAHEQLESYGEK